MNTTDIQALLDKQTEGARERNSPVVPDWCDDFTAFANYDRSNLLKTIDQYKRLMPWVGHSPTCTAKRLFMQDKEVCVCKLKAELEAIRKEIEG